MASHLLPGVKLTRHPSATAATTRANRRKARAWIETKGYATWGGGDWMACCNHGGHPDDRGHATSGAYVPSGNDAPHHAIKVCLDCIPFDGAPVRNHEHWTTNAERDLGKCARCFTPMGDWDGAGGVWSRGGPFCWACGSPDEDTYRAWLLAIRANPDAVPPWSGDKAEVSGGR